MYVVYHSYRFTDLFPDARLVRDMQTELDEVIQRGVVQLTRLLANSETGISSGTGTDTQEQFSMQQSKQAYLRGFCDVELIVLIMNKIININIHIQ